MSSQGARVRIIALAACVAVTLPRFLFDHAAAIQRMTLPWAVTITGWWLLPLFWFLRTAKSTILLWVGGILYVATAGVSLNSTYANDHSTAGFGVFFVPIYLAIGVAMVLGVERAVRHWRLLAGAIERS